MPILKKPAWLTKAQNVPKPPTQSESPKSASLFHRSVSNVEDVMREQRSLVELDESNDGASRKDVEANADVDELDSRHKKRRRVSHPDQEENDIQFKPSSEKKHSPRQTQRSSAGTSPGEKIDSPIRGQRAANAPIIDLGDSSEEFSDSDTPYVPTTRPVVRRKSQESTQVKVYSEGVRSEKKQAENAIMIEDDEEEKLEEEDPELAEMERLARERLAERKRKEAEEAKSQAFLFDEERDGRTADPVIQIYIDPKIERTEALMVKVRYSMRLKEIREAWCTRQKQWPPGVTANNVIFAFRSKRILDWSTIKHLGVILNEQGEPILRAASRTGKDGPGDKLIVEATTHALLDQAQKEQEEQRLREERGETLPAQMTTSGDSTTAPEGEAMLEQTLLRILLKSKNYPEQKLKVKPVRSQSMHISSSWGLLTSTRIQSSAGLPVHTERLRAFHQVRRSSSGSMVKTLIPMHRYPRLKLRIWTALRSLSKAEKTLNVFTMIGGMSLVSL